METPARTRVELIKLIIHFLFRYEIEKHTSHPNPYSSIDYSFLLHAGWWHQ